MDLESEISACDTVGTGFQVLAPAKVNLTLAVLGTRPNGYHDIRSVVVPVALFDTVRFEETDGVVETVVNGADARRGANACFVISDRNLATRAALLMKELAGCSVGVRLHLTKRIPVGGGLGGGSSDAAAVLVGLNEMWDVGLSREAMVKFGAQLGCDVPALVQGGAVLAEGLGELITPLDVSGSEGGDGWWLVVVNPGVNVSTRDIYSRYSSPLTSCQIPDTTMVSALENGDVDAAARGLFNDLQRVVFKKYPLVEMIVESLKREGAIGALLSGSGASAFGLARSEEHARRIAEGVNREFGSSLWTEVTRTLPDGVTVAHGPLEA